MNMIALDYQSTNLKILTYSFRHDMIDPHVRRTVLARQPDVSLPNSYLRHDFDVNCELIIPRMRTRN
jgi:hypothetical protein